MGHQQVDNCALADLVAVVRQHAVLPEGASHIDLLTNVVHLLLEQFEMIHVELLLLLTSSLGSHALARLVDVTVFIFNCQVFDFFPVTEFYRDLSSWSSRRSNSELLTPGCFTVPHSTSRGPSMTTLSSRLLKYLYGLMVPSTRVK